MKYLIFLFTFLIHIQLQAQPGSFDQSFGNAGIALGLFPPDFNEGMGVYQQSDGKILNVGTISQASSADDFYLLRYLSDGNLDSSFGTNGSVSGPIGSGNDQALDVIQQADSKILVVGGYDNPIERDVFIRRYDSIGVLDTSFANNGMVTTDFQSGGDDVALRVRIQPDGKILVCGTTVEISNFTAAVMILRYSSDGILDTSFGNGGKVLFSQLTGDQYFIQFVLQPDGKIVIVGVTEDVNGFNDILVVRFLPDGSLDNSFNGDGIFTFDLSNDDDEGWAIALQPDGKILIGGMGITINGVDDLLIRLDSTGYPDPSFNTTGILTKDHNQLDNYITNILLQADGKIITVGQVSDFVEKISLTRYLASGSDDPGFGNNGSIMHPIANDAYCNSAILQADNRIVITGWVETATTSNNFTARFDNDSLFSIVHELIVSDNRLYPVPASDKIYIKDLKYGSYAMVFDSRGQIVFHRRIESNSLDLSFLTVGIYLLRVQSDREQFVQKFVKE